MSDDNDDSIFQKKNSHKKQSKEEATTTNQNTTTKRTKARKKENSCVHVDDFSVLCPMRYNLNLDIILLYFFAFLFPPRALF